MLKRDTAGDQITHPCIYLCPEFLLSSQLLGNNCSTARQAGRDNHNMLLRAQSTIMEQKFQAQIVPNPLSLKVVKAKGSYIYDDQNRKYGRSGDEIRLLLNK